MKLIMERWKNYLVEREEKTVNIYFSGNCNDCSPEKVQKLDFSVWENENMGKLIIRSWKDTKYIHTGAKINKIIGFSAGAQAAYNLHRSNLDAELVFIDPLIPRNFDAPKNFTYEGTSCWAARWPRSMATKCKDKKGEINKGTFKEHYGFFLKYFKLELGR